jgi:hypothetical protein
MICFVSIQASTLIAAISSAIEPRFSHDMVCGFIIYHYRSPTKGITSLLFRYAHR